MAWRRSEYQFPARIAQGTEQSPDHRKILILMMLRHVLTVQDFANW